LNATEGAIVNRRAWLRLVLRTTAVALLATGCPSALLAQQPQQTQTLSGKALLDALRGGGYVLYFRHADTDFSANDDNMTSFEDCSKQRNLTEVGRTHAREIGAAIARLNVPVGDVLASPYCRTRETAQLVFGRATPSVDVRGGPALDRARYGALEKLLSTPVTGGANRVIVSHGNPFAAVAGPPYLAEGEAAVVQPRGSEGFRIVARVPRDSWDALAR
jgi:phosphohistidine phosphatase SixA